MKPRAFIVICILLTLLFASSAYAQDGTPPEPELTQEAPPPCPTNADPPLGCPTLTISDEGLVGDFYLGEELLAAGQHTVTPQLPANVSHNIAVRNISDGSETLGITHKYADVTVYVWVGSGQERGYTVYTREIPLVGAVQVTCDIRQAFETDDVACQVACDGQEPLPDLFPPGAVANLLLEPGTHQITVQPVGEAAHLWSPQSNTHSTSVWAGGTSRVRSTFNKSAHLLVSLDQEGVLADFYLGDELVAEQATGFDRWVTPFRNYTIKATSFSDPAAGEQYRYRDAWNYAYVSPGQEKTISLSLTKVYTEATPSSIPTTNPVDVSSLGEPAEPFSWHGFNPPGYLAYNDEDYHVYQRALHGRLVTIAWEKAAGIPQYTRDTVSDFYFKTFLNWWEIFGGFPFATYTVVLEVNPEFAGGEQGIGYEGYVNDYLDHYGERISHEVFHAWVGNAITDAPERQFDDGLWFREGVTQYYGDRGAGPTLYRNLMRGHWNEYKYDILGTDYDVPLTDMPAISQAVGEDPAGNNRPYRLNVYWKGALVAYMMDQRLTEHGLTMDDFLKALYDSYALQQRSFTTPDAIQVLNSLTGDDWSEFFALYIYGTEPLPLNGYFEYIQH
jgi:hypothetical protein